MRKERIVARERAEQKMREAGKWWAALDNAIHRYRCWAVLYVARKFARERYLEQRIFSGRVAEDLRRATEAAHDMMLIECANIQACVDCAQACELGARIYYEEFEERELSLLPNPDRFEERG